jgi:DNA-directed RNA polymerase subunit RPC12/RpoP
MQDLTRIATCSYCGTRALLSLRGRDRHELACSFCGAPLHLMKPLPMPAPQDDWSAPGRARAKEPVRARGWTPRHPPHALHPEPRRRRPGLLRRLAEELIDEIGDIID